MKRATFLVTALLALGTVAGCGDDKSTGSEKKSEEYPAEVEATFVKECKRTSGGKESICQCSFDNIKKTMSYTEFKREDTAIAAGRTPSKKFTDAVADCR